ncbi:hypothetical protein CROQUDRAFT_671180 [Cronartium quercuum f. sp. fusiforme G11]|uniref:Uncharacterized protein n=1 Tax=Cronartium quercuum f. sp. fusiforme G11 TaxID=708437 RepID=A0A9P6TC89_9BASI|nr:hypothetical protein CROQUDRAFT_671180 [Cronartium quercuum f. sp. fusiforme G11]
MSNSLSPPPLLARPSHRPDTSQDRSEDMLDEDEAPPAYSLTPQTQFLQSGPRYPFGPSIASHPHPHPHPHPFPPPPTHPSQHYSHQSPSQTAVPQPYHQSNPQPAHSWPQQPYEPQNTGNYIGSTSYTSQFNNATSSSVPHPNPPIPQPELQWVGSRDPTHVPTSGRPLLWDDRVLVYPPTGSIFCSKCCNTGYKGFDPSRPCRKCWEKYGQRWSVVRLSPGSETINLQRPLPPITPLNVHYDQPLPPLVVRPGDSRMGGRLCWNCDGKGEITDEGLFGLFFTSTDRCRVCMGAGRTF